MEGRCASEVMIREEKHTFSCSVLRFAYPTTPGKEKEKTGISMAQVEPTDEDRAPRSWYKMYRGWQDHNLFHGDEYSRRDAWEWMIANACWKPERVRIPNTNKTLMLNRGQLFFSGRFLAEKWKWTHARVHRFFLCLKNETMIETRSESGQSLITICNYELYQIVPAYSETRSETLSETRAKHVRNKEEEGEEVKNTPNPSYEGYTPKKISRKPGTRFEMPESGEPDDQYRAYAESLGWDQKKILRTFTKFGEYWINNQTKKAFKQSWYQAWCVWCNQQVEYDERDAKVTSMDDHEKWRQSLFPTR